MGFLPAMDVLSDLRSLKYHDDGQDFERNGIAFGDFIRGRKASAWPTELCPNAICPQLECHGGFKTRHKKHVRIALRVPYQLK